ncbi:hypothetical protein R1sor_022094 [Riccia sorocarpa]|uniref:Killer toxin Kp4 domain-containing protein n=1 Tax=Riccia sorocarpa TaxID=122646 RepID=A0ABD3GIW2_9MARC
MDTTMQHRVLALLLSALLLLNAATRSDALGINCRGSSNCASVHAPALSEINRKVQDLPNNNVYPNGQHIACSDNICAFLQNISGTKTGAQIKGYVDQLLAHGCSKCGNVPTEPGNDVSTGQLTVNWSRSSRQYLDSLLWYAYPTAGITTESNTEHGGVSLA